MTRRCIILFAVLAGCFICILPTHGQFVTKRLAHLAHETKIAINDSIRQSTYHDYDSLFFFHNHPIHIKTNPQGDVCHIGYLLFGKEFRQKNPSVVYDFLERYFLELDLEGSDAKRLLRLQCDNVSYSGNLMGMISSSAEVNTIIINREINHKYLIELQRGSHHVALTFNADYQLLLGANDIELEEILARKIRRIAANHNYGDSFKLIFDRYGYVKDTINFSRQDVIKLIEDECEEHSLRSKSDSEDVMYAINRELGFVHLATFKSNQVRLVAYIPIHDASDAFINRMVPPKNNERMSIGGESDALSIESETENRENVEENWVNEASMFVKQLMLIFENTEWHNQWAQ